MKLNLVKIVELHTNIVTYHAVNDLHYDSMLASGGTFYDRHYTWEYLGDVEISEEILNEQGLYYKDEL